MRVMWWIAGTVLFVGALTAGAYQVVTVLAHEERTETVAYPAADLTSVDVATGNGAVRVTTSDSDEVVVQARISEGLRPTGEEQQVVGDTLQLRASCPNFGSDWCAVDYTLEVPRHMALVIRTDDGPIEGSDLGSVTVDADADHGRGEPGVRRAAGGGVGDDRSRLGGGHRAGRRHGVPPRRRDRPWRARRGGTDRFVERPLDHHPHRPRRRVECAPADPGRD